jgi:uncharacterized protein YbjQ (UPF0145 family)
MLLSSFILKMDRRVVKGIFITPLEKPEGLKIRRYLGLTQSTVVDMIPPHLELRTLFSSAKKRRSPIDTFISTLMHEALEKLEENAKKMGGNAVLGLKMGVEHLGWGRILVYAYGTVAEVEE